MFKPYENAVIYLYNSSYIFNLKPFFKINRMTFEDLFTLI